ncbi:MAG: ATP synthase F1 subunit delta [Bryobacteraceae bacterium]
MALAVASRYAKALADLVMHPSQGMDADEATAQMQSFENVLKEFPDFRNVILSPAVAPARKRAVIKRLAGILGISRLIRNFLLVVVDHRRIHVLPDIREAFRALVNARLGVEDARVASARELTAEQRAAVTSELSRLTGKRIRCGFAVDETLIGGLTAQIGSTIYDGSVRGQLESLRRKLVAQ